MSRLSKLAVLFAATALPLAVTTPAQAYEFGGCNGTYVAVGGTASQSCQFVYTGGTITLIVTINGPAGYKYVTIGLYPGGQWCEGDGGGSSATCRTDVQPNVSLGTLMTCSSAAVGYPYGTVTYSCK